MFGILKGCGCGLDRVRRQQWYSHICSTCLALRQGYGHWSRFLTNHDAVLLSVLSAAQGEPSEAATQHRCALRRFRPVTVSSGTGPQYAACMSVWMAATRAQDHWIDGDRDDRWAMSRFARPYLSRWMRSARSQLKMLGLNFDLPTEQVQRQVHAERIEGQPFHTYSKPTEHAVGLAFGNTALLAAQPANVGQLYELGACFGRLMVLLDSYRDYASDWLCGHFNALAQSLAPSEIDRSFQHIAQDTHTSLRQHLVDLQLARPALINALLGRKLGQVLQSAESGDDAPKPAGTKKPKQRERMLDVCCCGCECCDLPIWCCAEETQCSDGCSGCEACSCGDTCNCCSCCDCS